MPDTIHRPRLLFLGQALPYPPDTGVAVRTYNILRILARSFDITALCFYRRGHLEEGGTRAARVAALSALAHVEAFPIPQEQRRERLLWDHLRSVACGRVYTHYAYHSEAFATRLKLLLRQQSFDLAHVDSLDLAAYMPMLKGLPVVCVHHNAESVLLRRRAAREPSRWKSAYIGLQARLMAREERLCCPRVALNVTVSAEDLETLRSQAPVAGYDVVPNGVDIDYFAGASADGDGVVFLGGSEWFPNLDGMRYFARAVLPLLRSGADPPRVRWIGRVSEAVRGEFEREGIELMGYVDDVRPALASAACVVVPLRVGGGTRLKILTAWAMGKAVVSTSLGCEGLRAVDGDNILVRDGGVELAAAVRAVLRDAPLRRRLGRSGRVTAEDYYSWRVIGKPMTERYLALAGAAGPRLVKAHAAGER